MYDIIHDIIGLEWHFWKKLLAHNLGKGMIWVSLWFFLPNNLVPDCYSIQRLASHLWATAGNEKINKENQIPFAGSVNFKIKQDRLRTQGSKAKKKKKITIRERLEDSPWESCKGQIWGGQGIKQDRKSRKHGLERIPESAYRDT